MHFYLKEKSKTSSNNFYFFNIEVSILNFKNSFLYVLNSEIFGIKKNINVKFVYLKINKILYFMNNIIQKTLALIMKIE